MDGDLLITTDTKGTNGISRFAEHWFLVSELLKHLNRVINYEQSLCQSQITHLRSSSKTVSGFTDAAVDNEFVDLQGPHDILALVLSHGSVGSRFLHLTGLARGQVGYSSQLREWQPQVRRYNPPVHFRDSPSFFIPKNCYFILLLVKVNISCKISSSF